MVRGGCRVRAEVFGPVLLKLLPAVTDKRLSVSSALISQFSHRLYINDGFTADLFLSHT